MRNQFSTLDACKILKLNRERLRDWMNRGFVIPSVQKAKGQGTKALFSRDDLYMIRTFGALLENRIARERAAESVEAIINLRGKSKEYKLIMECDYILFRSGYKIHEGKAERDVAVSNLYTGELLDLTKGKSFDPDERETIHVG